MEDIEGQTPLHYALDFDKHEIVHELLVQGWDTSVDKYGENMLARCVRNSSWKCVAQLIFDHRSKKSWIDSAIKQASDSGYLALFTKLRE